MTDVPGVVRSRRATWFPIVPDGTNSAASFPTRSAKASWRALTVGSSPYTSSPTSASAMARRISGVGWVTVSERRSAYPDGTSSRLLSPRRVAFGKHVARPVGALPVGDGCLLARSGDEPRTLEKRVLVDVARAVRVHPPGRHPHDELRLRPDLAQGIVEGDARRAV